MPYELGDEFFSSANLWRSKEKIRGQISSREFDPEIFRLYGEILLSMHDTLDAGRYLFFSGARANQYQQAIELFLARFDGKPPARLFEQAPRSLRQNQNLEEYFASPGFVQSGWTPEMLEVARRPLTSRPSEPPSLRKRISKRLSFIGIMTFLGFLVVSTLVGAISILRVGISMLPISGTTPSVVGRAFLAAIIFGGFASIVWRIVSRARRR